MIKRTAFIEAKSDLLACRNPYGFSAGRHHFVDLWARDSLFATLGATAIGDFDATKKTIETFLKHQRPDGLVPYRILRAASTIGKYLGKPRYLDRPAANFRSHQSGGLVPDGGLMTVVAAAQYARASGDVQFIKQHIEQLARALRWYEKHFKNRLISEWFLCEWADAVLKLGNTLYTNILYWRALGDCSFLVETVGDPTLAQQMKTRQHSIGKLIQEKFWNGRYFADWIDWRRQDYFASHPNMLAIVFGLATGDQARSVLNYAKRHCWTGWTLATNDPPYPWWRIPLHHYAAGMRDYHNGLRWLQPGVLYTVALAKCGRSKEARRVLESIAEKIAQHGGVYEVYEQNGNPVKRLLYRSEHPFAWSAGLYLWASSIIFGNRFVVR